MLHRSVRSSVCDRWVPHKSDNPSYWLLRALDLAEVHGDAEHREIAKKIMVTRSTHESITNINQLLRLYRADIMARSVH